MRARMYDVLIYLIEQYAQPDSGPESGTLAERLSAAGFEGDEINDALHWLSGLTGSESLPLPVAFADRKSFRVLTTAEREHLGEESTGFLYFLESAGVLDPLLREVVIERAVAANPSPVPLESFKIIVL